MVIQKVKKIVSNVTRPDWRNQSRHFYISRELHQFRKIFRDNSVTLIISAFGVVAALSWNEAIKEAVSRLFPTQGALVAKLYSAIVITIISIFVTYLLSKLKTQSD